VRADSWHAGTVSGHDTPPSVSERPAETDPACALARGAGPEAAETRVLVAVFDSPVAAHLLHFARDCGYGTLLLEPRGEEATGQAGPYADTLLTRVRPDLFDGATDVVVTDHDRAELGEVLRDLLATRTRWVGVMGSPRHAPPHVPALQALGVSADTIARVHRPIGLNIGSRSPAEIALATVAGLIADRRERPGGFEFG
jgi:xanthine dehydrogenase accessory factor